MNKMEHFPFLMQLSEINSTLVSCQMVELSMFNAALKRYIVAYMIDIDLPDTEVIELSNLMIIVEG